MPACLQSAIGHLGDPEESSTAHPIFVQLTNSVLPRLIRSYPGWLFINDTAILVPMFLGYISTEHKDPPIRRYVLAKGEPPVERKRVEGISNLVQ